MRSIYSITRLIYGPVIAVVILLTAGGDAFAQRGHGKGRGNGGNGHGRGQQQHSSGWESKRQQKADNGNDGRQQQVSDRNSRQQQVSDWHSRRQQQASDQNSRRQQQVSDWNSRRQQQASDQNSRRQQQASDWNSRRQQQVSDQNSRRQQQASDRNSRQQQQVSNWDSRRQQQASDQNSRRQSSDWNSRRQQQQSSDWNSRRQQPQNYRSGWQQIWTDRRERFRGNDNDNRRGRRHQRRQAQVNYSRVQIIPGFVWNGSTNGFRDDRRYRRETKRAWNNERRYQKEQRRYARYNRRSNNYDFGSGNYYADNYYRDDLGFDNRSGWEQQILRVVLGNVIGGDFDRSDRFDVTQRYQPTYGNSYDYGTHQPRPAYYNSPLYTGYDHQGYDVGFEDQYADDDSGLGGLLNDLPIADLIGQFTGGNDFVSELLGNFLAQGYDQGFVAGQYARKHGDEDEYYSDPYAYQGGVCDPYSASLGQNRQSLSEGYALGYQDALNGRQDYDPASEGNVDLVSLLLNSALSRI